MTDLLEDASTGAIIASDALAKSVPQLPIELVERIVDFLHRDTYALRNCALASRVFLMGARVHLFRIIHVPHARAWDNLEAAVRVNPVIASLVRTFSVSDHKQFLSVVLLAGDNLLPKAVSSVTHLRLRDVDYLGPHINQLNALLPNATSLELERVRFKFSRYLFACIMARPRLRRLALLGISIGLTLFGDEDVEGPVLDALGVTDLHLDGHAVSILLGLHLGFSEVTLNMAPKRLLVDFMTDDHLLPLAHLLRMIGGELEEFTMIVHEEVPGPYWQTIPEEDAFLAHCPALHSIKLVNLTPHIYQLGPILLAALVNVASEVLDCITLEIHIRSRDELLLKPSDLVALHYPCLQEVNDLLESPHFASLREFHLDVFAPYAAAQRHMPTPESIAKARENISIGSRTLFPLLAARNVLRHTCHFPMDPGWKSEGASFRKANG